jgi:xylulokinase
VNSFAHVNHSPEISRLGVLLCINGTGILYSWLKQNLGGELDYEGLNELARAVPAGSDGLTILPFGNGSERVLGNLNAGCQIGGLNFNTHGKGHLVRAAQEGIVFSFMLGMEVMKEMGIKASVIRAGNANMFLSDIFTGSLATLTNAQIEIYDTDGSMGAARAAGLGSGIYQSEEEAFTGFKKIRTMEPGSINQDALSAAYAQWMNQLEKILN